MSFIPLPKSEPFRGWLKCRLWIFVMKTKDSKFWEYHWVEAAMSRKRSAAENVAHLCEQVVDLDHPQMGFILLRQCCGTCRVVHLLRALDTKESNTLVEAVDKSIMDAALSMLRAASHELS